MSTRRLTERQAAFVRGIAGGKTAAQAARDAGYSVAYADRQAAQLLVNPQVKAHLASLTARLAAPEIADADERQRWWTTIVRDKLAEMKDRLRASELLGKSHGDFIERHEHGGPGGAALPAAQLHVYLGDNGRGIAPPIPVTTNGNGRRG